MKMVKFRDAEDRGKVSTDDSDTAADADADADATDGSAASSGPVLWPAVRTTEDGRVDCKHVHVYGHKWKVATGDDRCCTRIPIDESALWGDSDGDYSLVPDLEVQQCYFQKRVKEEVLFWPAVREVDGKEEVKHVRVHDGEVTNYDCRRLKRWKEKNVKPDCNCYDCKRAHRKFTLRRFEDSSRDPFDRRDLSASDGRGDFRLLPDHKVFSLWFHDETTAKENDDGGFAWESILKGSAIKKKGEGRAVHISDVVGVDRGVSAIGQEAWRMMQEDKDVQEGGEVEVSPEGPATEAGEKPESVPREDLQHYGRSGIYFGREEVDGEVVPVVKYVQDAVALLKALPADYQVTKTGNDPRTGAVIMTVGANQDGYWTCDRMCKQIPGFIAIHELTSEPHRPGVFIFDNSTGHGAFEEGALLANHIQLRPGGQQPILHDFHDDNGDLVHGAFREGDELLFSTNIYAPKTLQQLQQEREAADNNPKFKKPRNGDKLGYFREGDVVSKDAATAGLIGLPKGARQLLLELQLWAVDGEKTLKVLECKECKAERAATREAITAFNRGGEGRQQALDDAAGGEEDDGGDGEGAEGGAAGNRAGKRRRCCAVRVLSELKAFKEELNKVEKLFKKAGHLCIFLPKYHPELNAIERFWGYVKYLLRLHCEYSLRKMLEILPGALSGVPLDFIRGWSRVTWLYLEAYDEGLVDYLECRDLKSWMTHRSATNTGDAVVQAREGAGKSNEEK